MERDVTYVDVSHTCLSSSLLSHYVILIVPIIEYRYRFEVWNAYLSSESYLLFLPTWIRYKTVAGRPRNDGLAVIWLSSPIDRRRDECQSYYIQPFATTNEAPLRFRRAAPLRRRSRGGGENCLADNRRMWSINCIVTCMSFSLSTRYFHRLPPEVALMGNVDRAQKR